MYHKLIYALTEEKKLLHYEALQKLKNTAAVDDIFYGDFSGIIAKTTDDLNNGERVFPNGTKLKISYKLIDSIRVPKSKAEYEGQKGVFVCTQSQYDSLMTACKVENYTRKQNGDPLISFEQFVNNIINFFVNQRIKIANQATMDAERNQLKSELEAKSKPKEKSK